MNHHPQLDNYKSPPLISGATYTFKDLQYTEIEKIGKGQRRECWRVQLGSEFRAVLKENFHKNDVEDLILFQKVVVLLDGHPNVVKTYSTFWTFLNNNCTFFIVQDCFTNCMIDLVNEYYFCNNEPEVHSVFLQLAEGLSFMHQRGVTNNDISLDNIFFKLENNHAIVAYGDLGGAEIEGIPSSSSTINPTYASPSRFLDAKKTQADDVCSLGLCVSAIQWDYYKGELPLPYEEYEMMPHPKNINICMMNFRDKLESNRWKTLLLEMMADLRTDRPTATTLLSRVKAFSP